MQRSCNQGTNNEGYPMINPLIADTNQETLENVSEAMDAFMTLLAHTDSNMARLLAPLHQAIDYVANNPEAE
ncbi:MAG: hypothetical protein WC997_02310 [Porticoccaceae bacterium]